MMRVSLREYHEVSHVERQDAAPLSCGAQELGFVSGIEGHPVAWGSCHIVSSRDQRTVKRSYGDVGVEVKPRLRHGPVRR